VIDGDVLAAIVVALSAGRSSDEPALARPDAWTVAGRLPDLAIEDVRSAVLRGVPFDRIDDSCSIKF